MQHTSPVSSCLCAHSACVCLAGLGSAEGGQWQQKQQWLHKACILQILCDRGGAHSTTYMPVCCSHLLSAAVPHNQALWQHRQGVCILRRQPVQRRYQLRPPTRPSCAPVLRGLHPSHGRYPAAAARPSSLSSRQGARTPKPRIQDPVGHCCACNGGLGVCASHSAVKKRAGGVS